VNLVRIKLKLRHFGKGFDRIAKVQSAEGRRDLERAWVSSTHRPIGFLIGATLVDVRYAR
jgi:hypothetical protein